MKRLPIQNMEKALNKSAWACENVDGLPLIFSPLLKEFPFLRHAFSTRLGGDSKAPLDSFNVGRLLPGQHVRQDMIKNRARLCQTIGLDVERLLVPDMSHSNIVVFMQETGLRPKADGIATNALGLPILMTFADCVPVIILDPIKKVLALVHAGWRGTSTNIVREAVELLAEDCLCRPGDLVAAIGPAIGPCCYPTGAEVASKLFVSLVEPRGNPKNEVEQALCQPSLRKSSSLEEGAPERAKFEADLVALVSQFGLTGFFLLNEGSIHPDLKAINALQLYEAGVSRIDVTSFCTACQPRLFYSHRQSGGQAGRQGAIACLTSN